jgi:hypothetical protein
MFRRHFLIDEQGNQQTVEFTPLDRNCIEYEEACSKMERILGNFGYGFNKTTLRAFMEVMAAHFKHKDRATEAEFVGAAMMAWRYGDKDPPAWDGQP